MRVESQLGQWLNDKGAQRLARDEADAFAISWNDGSVNKALATAMAHLRDGSAESIADAISTVFGDAAVVDILVQRLAASLREDAFFEPPFRYLNSDIHSGLVIFEDEQVSVAAGVTSLALLAEKKRNSKGGSIAFSGQIDVFKFLTAGGACLSFWEAPRITEDFTAAQAGRCARVGERRIEDGDILILDGRSRSFIIEHAATNLVVLQATVKIDRAPVSVEYDRDSREYVGCSAADDSASRIQMITTLLRKLDHTKAFPVITEFLDHPSFFVRWHVMRELLGLDAAAALPHLRRMAANDPHPETRRAARSVLVRMSRPQAVARTAA